MLSEGSDLVSELICWKKRNGKLSLQRHVILHRLLGQQKVMLKAHICFVC